MILSFNLIVDSSQMSPNCKTHCRPGKQNWFTYCKTPVAGNYQLTQTLSVNVSGPEAGRNATSDDWKGGELTSGTIEFEIVDGGKP